MPSLEEALHKQAEAEVAEAERIETSSARERLAAEHAEFARLERLIANEDVAWLLSEMKRLVDDNAGTFENAACADEESSLSRNSRLTFTRSVRNASDR